MKLASSNRRKRTTVINKFIYWIGIISGLTAAVLLATGSPLKAQALWVISNAAMVLVNWKIRQRGQAFLFAVYTVTNAVGAINYAWGVVGS